jgi:hypothetical protein
MRQRTWSLRPPKPPPRPKVPDDVKAAILEEAAPVVADLKKRFCKKPKNPQFNWPDDLFVRWHRDALYFVAVMRTPHDQTFTFELHVARMEHAGKLKFNLAVPRRRGWNTIKKDLTPEACLKEILKIVYL